MQITQVPEHKGSAQLLQSRHKDYGWIGCQGENTFDFLQGQLTADLASLQINQSLLSAMCNNKGRVLAILLVFRCDDAWYLGLPRSLLAPIGKRLKQVAKLSAVRIYNASDVIKHYVITCQSSAPLTTIFPGLTGWQPGTIRSFGEISVIMLPSPLSACIVLSRNHAALEHTWVETAQRCHEHDNGFHLHAIMHGLVTITAINTGRYLAHPLCLDKWDLISVKKGCYVGQEIIARTHYLGHVKKHTHYRYVNTHECPTIGQLIFLDDADDPQIKAGEVVDVEHDHQGYALLVTLQDKLQSASLLLRTSCGQDYPLQTHPPALS